MYFTPFLYNFDLPNQVRCNANCLPQNPSQVAYKFIMVENQEKQAFGLNAGHLKI